MSEKNEPLPTRRADLLARLAEPRTWDLAVVGGGATGLGVALDAAARGLSVVLLESHDFAHGTSSRSTKLLHGGVRYLAQGNLALVREALHERSTVLRNAPHLASRLSFVMPSHSWWQTPFYGIGLKLYDLLAGRAGLGPTAFLGRAQTLAALPNLQPAGLCGGVSYWDGQFDDARLALALARTAAREGALLLNYCAVKQLLHHEDGRVAGLRCEDRYSGQAYEVRARCVVNATGVWVDALRQLDGAAQGRSVEPVVAPSQGVHVVVDRDFLPGEHALLVPKTADGRVLFAVPWLGKLVLGTTDTPRSDLPREPRPLRAELDFILGEAARYLQRAPTRADVKSIWVGLRPLVRPAGDDSSTGRLSREHAVLTSPGGLVSVTGGKWTTYRAMAEDVLAHCMAAGLLPPKPGGGTAGLQLLGAGIDPGSPARPGIAAPPDIHLYGSEAAVVQALPGGDRFLAPGLSEAMVRFAARYEYALTVGDVLARRNRLLFLDAALAEEVAPRVGAILAEETGQDARTADFAALAREYLRWPVDGA